MLGREAAESRLDPDDIGSYLLRWSESTNCYVLSYVTKTRTKEHIGQIMRNGPEEIKVKSWWRCRGNFLCCFIIRFFLEIFIFFLFLFGDIFIILKPF